MKQMTKEQIAMLPHRRWKRVEQALQFVIAAANSGDLNTAEKVLFGVNWSQPSMAPASSGEFVHAQNELASARRDLIELAERDPIAAAGRVRRIQADMRRLWLPRLQARHHRPRLRLNEEEE